MFFEESENYYDLFNKLSSIPCFDIDFLLKKYTIKDIDLLGYIPIKSGIQQNFIIFKVENGFKLYFLFNNEKNNNFINKKSLLMKMMD